MQHDELEHHVPAAPSGDQLAAIKASLARIERVLIGDPFDPKAPPGLVARQDAQERHLADHENRLIKLEDDVPTRTQLRTEFAGHGDRLARLEAKDEKASDRWMAFFIDLLKTLGGGIAGAYLASKGGPHP